MTSLGGTSRSRSRAGALAMLAAAAAIATCALVAANIAARRYSLRVDVTATGEHRLSDRTQRMLSAAGSPWRIVVAGDLRAIEPARRQRVNDVLDQFARASSGLRVQIIDTGAGTGQTEFAALVKDLAERDRAVIETQVADIGRASEAGAALCAVLESRVSQALQRIAEPAQGTAPAARQALLDRAAAARLAARDLRAAIAAAQSPLASKTAGVALARTDAADKALAPALRASVELARALEKELRTVAQSTSVHEASRGAAGDALSALSPATDDASAAAERCSVHLRPDALRVASALEGGSGCILIGPAGTGIGAFSLENFYSIDASTADAGRRAEELIAGGMASLADATRPILVIMHAEARSGIVDRSGIFVRLVDRLGARGIDVVEWPVMLQPAPAALDSVKDARTRPVVYASFAPDSSSAASTAGGPAGPQQAARLGEALTSLAGAHKPLLISMNPSVLPGYGQPDPTVSVLEKFGLKADSGRPVLTEKLSPRGRTINTDRVLQPLEGPHPILRALGALPTYLPWPIALEELPAGASARSVTPLFAISNDPQAWRESQWLGVWQTPRADRPLMPNMPAFDSGRDAPGAGCMIGAAVEQTAGDGARERLVAIGSNSWFLDVVTAPQTTVDGRTISANPGNLELFEASVLWLAGKESVIAQSPQALSVPLIAALSPGTLSAVRWGIAAGIPVVVLALGVLAHHWRRRGA